MSKIITVDFRQDTLFAVERDDGVFVAIKPICDTLGIDWKAQKNRIDRSRVLSEGRVVTTLPSVGGSQETVCLRLDLINGWLFGIDVERVRPDRQDLVTTYQEECYAVLFRHFYGRAPTERAADLKGNPLSPLPGGKITEKDPARLRRQLVAEVRQVFGLRAARELYFKLGLDTVPAMFEPAPQSEMFTYTAIRHELPESSKEEAA